MCVYVTVCMYVYKTHYQNKPTYMGYEAIGYVYIRICICIYAYIYRYTYSLSIDIQIQL